MCEYNLIGDCNDLLSVQVFVCHKRDKFLLFFFFSSESHILV